jgi:hypothetical protein
MGEIYLARGVPVGPQLSPRTYHSGSHCFPRDKWKQKGKGGMRARDKSFCGEFWPQGNQKTSRRHKPRRGLVVVTPSIDDPRCG